MTNAERMRKAYCQNPKKYREISRQNRLENPETTQQRLDRLLKSRYGISFEDFEHLRKQQKNLCALCLKKLPLTVDHCHKTGRVRGLLCGNCNRGIGCLKENLATLKRAINYLQKTNHNK